MRDDTCLSEFRIKRQPKEKSCESKMMICFNALIRPFTTLFWLVAYPIFIGWVVYKGVMDKDPLVLLAPFTQDIIRLYSWILVYG